MGVTILLLATKQQRFIIIMWQIQAALFFFIVVCGVQAELEIIKFWNGIAQEGTVGVIAIKANGPIEECVWTHQDNDDEYSNKDSSRDVEVILGEEDTLCKLRVKKADIDDHDGLWDVEISGKCNDKGRRGRKRRKKRQVVSFPGSVIDTGSILNGSPAKTRLRSRKRGNPVLRRNKVNFRRRNGSTSSQLRSDCNVFANIEDIELFVAEKSSKSSDILMLPGQ